MGEHDLEYFDLGTPEALLTALLRQKPQHPQGLSHALRLKMEMSMPLLDREWDIVGSHALIRRPVLSLGLVKSKTSIAQVRSVCMDGRPELLASLCR